MCFEQKEVSNGLVGKEQGLGSPEEEESRVNDVSQDVNNGLRGASQVNNGFQVLPPQSQGSVVRWERILPTRSLKVLLVENDDSTRHVVTALLRNCSYDVSAAANGLEAWKILEDPNNHNDLVLTEVVMPVLSGIGLLCKIMSHRTLKNIPVIMMSSHDSMGIVFKCLSKGAVDFLVKPIRKNELKNLWQHVWRRCHSSSGSGSETGTQTRKSIMSRSNDESEKDTGSSDEHRNGSTGLSIQDGSDNGSGTQNSRAGEVDSSLQMSPGDSSADAPDSTCAQVIHTEPGNCTNRWVHSTETKECQEQDEHLDSVAIDKDLEKGVSSNSNLQCEYQQKLSLPLTSKRQDKLPDVDNKPFDKGQLDHNNEKISSSANINCTKPLDDGRIFDISIDVSSISQMKASCDSGEFPSLEVTLKRPRGPGDVGNAVHDDSNILRHSDLSAFSRYNTVSSANQTLTGNVGSCSPVDNSSVAPNTGTMHNFPSHTKGTPLNQQSVGSSDNNAMASTNKYVVPKEEALNDKPESESAFKSSHLSAFQPLQSGFLCLAPQGTTRKEDDARAIPVQAPHRDSHQRVQVQHHHHHHHHYHHHVHNVQQPLQPDHDDHSLKEMAETAQQCASSNVFGGHVESQAGNYSVNGSASGSNHGSNGHNGSSTALNVGMKNLEGDNGAAENSGGGGISRRNNGNEVEENQVAQRVAALTKFRQKRKERCYEKRVRYHSRKKLAEQRPRIRGQFVRQSETNAGKEYQSEDPTSGDNSGESAQ